MHDLAVLMTFTGGLAGALLFGYVAKRVKLSPIVGYLLAGILVGPFTPGFVANHAIAEQLAEIGVILLLFGIGLHFNLRELVAVWRVAVPGALIQSAASTLMLAAILRLFGWEWAGGIVLGLSISVASTVVMGLVLGERGDLHAPIGHIAIGWTVVEDLITVTVLLLLPIVFGDHASDGGDTAAIALGIAALKVVGLVITVIVLARWVIPWVLDRIEATRSRELFTLAVLVLAMGIAVGSAEVFGVSMALGAFLAGLAVGRSDHAARAATDAMPMRDAFAVLFFVSVGMLCDPRTLLDAPHLIAAVFFVVVVGKPLAAILVVRALGRPRATAIPVGAAFSQVGEFSFILASSALGLGVIDEAGWNALIATSILSIALNPFIYGLARKLAGAAAPISPATGEPLPVDPRRVVLIGYGPVGQTLHKILLRLGQDVTVVELNLETVRALRSEGHAAVYGDVLRTGTLDEAEVLTAGSMILSVEVENATEVIRQARVANPKLRVLARCAHLRDVAELRDAGATVVAGEGEVAVALAEALYAENADHEMGAIPNDAKALLGIRTSIRDQLYGNDVG